MEGDLFSLFFIYNFGLYEDKNTRPKLLQKLILLVCAGIIKKNNL
jgi:hypothetical protein